MKNELCETEKIRNLAAALKDALQARDSVISDGATKFDVKKSVENIAKSLWITTTDYVHEVNANPGVNEAAAPDEKASDEEKLTVLGDGGEAEYFDLLVDKIEGKGGHWLE